MRVHVYAANVHKLYMPTPFIISSVAGGYDIHKKLAQTLDPQRFHGRDQGLSDKVGFLIWAPAQLSAEGAYAKPSERDYDQHARSKYNTRVCDEIRLVIMMGASHKQRKF